MIITQELAENIDEGEAEEEAKEDPHLNTFQVMRQQICYRNA